MKHTRSAWYLGCQVLATFNVNYKLPMIVHHKYLPKSYNLSTIKIPGCIKTKGTVRKGDIIIIIIAVRKRKLEQEKKGCWYQK